MDRITLINWLEIVLAFIACILFLKSKSHVKHGELAKLLNYLTSVAVLIFVYKLVETLMDDYGFTFGGLGTFFETGSFFAALILLMYAGNITLSFFKKLDFSKK